MNTTNGEEKKMNSYHSIIGLVVLALGSTYLIPSTAEANPHKWHGLRQSCREQHDNYHPGRWRPVRPAVNPGWRQPSRFEGLIDRGIRNGDLSYREARELREKEEDIADWKNRYWDDGRISRRERKDLDRRYQDLYGDIRHELNDGERRFRY